MRALRPACPAGGRYVGYTFNNRSGGNHMITDMKDAKIFSPLQLGRTTLKNRIAMAPMSMHYEATNGTVPKQLADIFVRRRTRPRGRAAL